MKKAMIVLTLVLSMLCLTGCSELDPDALLQKAETIASQIDVEKMITDLVSSIDWEELKEDIQSGYNALTEKYPALKQENIKSFLKGNGLKLMGKLVSGTDEAGQENAKKLGEIIKILCPELSDEVDSVFVK